MTRAKVIAFYLPQYRPIPENDLWFGKGFTEWTSVAKCKPLFNGHYQPKVPSDLGFYDLRIPSVKEEQANLAKEAGIDAFCYYHYWFGNGKVILDECLNEVISSKKPDFPFCLCWANESWYKKCWHSETGYLSQEMLLEQLYPGIDDYDKHFYSLLNAFKDERYYKIKGKNVFVIYNLNDFPNEELPIFTKRWQELAKINGLPDFYFISYTTSEEELSRKDHLSLDATILSLFKSPVIGITNRRSVKSIINSFKGVISKFLNKPMIVFDYAKVYHQFASNRFSETRVYPVLVPNWDNSPRRGAGGLIYTNSTPENFKKHVEEVLNLVRQKKEEENFIFLKSWNEWGEGNYMEPDLKYGKGYINVLHEVLDSVNK